ncbi:MAG: hypothetical protein EOP49_20930 [Sphingobacteriales bacterium]|nr:MAG: hypothetical protein EOP49_20930 [Sphingobacteriales bacterium]
MNKLFYSLRLIPSRPDFAFTMTDDEKEIMGEHVAYWTELMNRGKVYAFGPVMDPKGPYGLGIVAVDSEEEVKEIMAKDPAGRINNYECLQMMAVVPELKG